VRLQDSGSSAASTFYLPYGHRAEAFHTALLQVLGALPEYVRLTLTWDQGSEMALHERISAHFRDGVYFAYPASPRQRGTNENTNGLLTPILSERHVAVRR
jgi:transposase, IS30 family